MLRGAMPVDGSICRFLGDFFLYWPSVSPYSSGRDDEYWTVTGGDPEKKSGGGTKKKRRDRTKNSRFPTQVYPAIY